MKKRFLYAILFGAPGLLVALIAAFLVAGSVAGALWVFAFGDNPWPPAAGGLVGVLFALVFLAVWLASLIIGYGMGKRLEHDPASHRQHILISVGVTVAFILLIVVQQISIGNLGPKSVGVRCGDYCTRQGYSASSTSPRDSGNVTCGCLDSTGNGIVTILLNTLGR